MSEKKTIVIYKFKMQTLYLPINPKRRISSKLVLTGWSAWEVGQAHIGNSFLLSSFLHSQLFLPLLFPLLYLTWLKKRNMHTGTCTPRLSYTSIPGGSLIVRGYAAVISDFLWVLTNLQVPSISAGELRVVSDQTDHGLPGQTAKPWVALSLSVRYNWSFTGGFNRRRQPTKFAAYFLYQISFESLRSLPNQYLVLKLMPEYRHFRASRFQNFLGSIPP